MAQRLIDAEAFGLEISKMCFKKCPEVNHGRNCDDCEIYLLAKKIENAPTIDAKPVVNAHWEYAGESDGKKIYRCTNCQALLSGTGNFCKECGAQMDEEVE